MDLVNQIWDWIMSRGFVEYLVIAIAVGFIIREILRLISKLLKSRKNGRNGRNGRNDRR